MEDIQLQQLLETYNQKIEEARVLNMQSWVLNYKCHEELQVRKAKSKLNRLILFKSLMVLAGILWVSFLSYLLWYSLEWEKIFFVISVSAIIAITSVAIVVYIYHIVLITHINNSESVIANQEKITRLRLSTIRIARILFLQAPFYCTFWWNFKMISEAPFSFWLISVPIALGFAFISLWLFRNISIKNIDKKWFRILFNSPEWTSLEKARNYLQEIESFKKNNYV